MIQYTLKCSEDHQFDSWFQSSGTFDKLLKTKMVNCAVCGSTDVEKAIMAPRVRDSKSSSEPVDGPPVPTLNSPDNLAEQALADLRKKVEDNSEYVGMNFAREAREINDGTSPNRAIYGEAKPEEARQLIEEGVPVTPLPFVPARKTN